MKKILAFFRKLFLKNKDKLKKIIDEEQVKVIDEDQVKVIDGKQAIIKNINWELINSLNIDDIILVKMTNELINQGQIEGIHQRRPFLISEKDDNKEFMSGYYFTGNINNYFFKREKK